MPMQGQRALVNVLMKRVAALLGSLDLPKAVPLAQAEGQMYDLLSSFDVRSAVPTMAKEVQDCLVLVCLAAVARYRMPQMASILQPDTPKMAALLDDIGLTSELFICLLECLVDKQ